MYSAMEQESKTRNNESTNQVRHHFIVQVHYRFKLEVKNNVSTRCIYLLSMTKVTPSFQIVRMLLQPLRILKCGCLTESGCQTFS